MLLTAAVWEGTELSQACERQGPGEGNSLGEGKVAPHLAACFLYISKNSFTSSGDPKMTGALWWMSVGTMSSMASFPVVANPPAFSMT